MACTCAGERFYGKRSKKEIHDCLSGVSPLADDILGRLEPQASVPASGLMSFTVTSAANSQDVVMDFLYGVTDCMAMQEAIDYTFEV
jgi:hypothetical protein